MAKFMPENVVPAQLNFQDIDETLLRGSVDKGLFVTYNVSVLN